MNNEENGSVPEGEVKEQETQPEKPINTVKTLTTKQKRLHTAFQWTMITVGSLMMAMSVFFFQTPYQITLGGIAGVAYLLQEGVGLSQGIWLIILNGALLVIGLIVLGKSCTLRTIYSCGLYTGAIFVLEKIAAVTNMPEKIAGNETFLALVYAIILFGVGGALIFNCGASSGGTDIIALIFKKYVHINVGLALMIIDFVVVCISITTLESREIVMYSLMGLLTKSFLLDSVIEGLGRTKYITIITSMPEEIGQYIVEKVNHSYTVYDARGGYTGDSKQVILTICKRSEAWKIKTKIKAIDPNAFVIISNANEIVGKGFGGWQ